MTDGPKESNYRRDGEGRLIHDHDTVRRYVQHYVDELIGLEQQTDPQGGAATAQEKDTKAYKALQLAAGLVDQLADWAIDHQSGLAVEGLGYAPRLSERDASNYVLGEVRTIVGDPAYQEEMEKVDAHRHEAAGADDLWVSLLDDNDDVDPVIARTILVNVLRPLAAGMDRFFVGHLLNCLADSLERLNVGEQTILFEPTKRRGQNRNTHSKRRLELAGLACAEYMVEMGYKAEAARDYVASAFGAGNAAAVRQWIYRLPDALGQLSVDATLRRARDAAAIVREWKHPNSRVADQDTARFLEHRYGEESLKRYGQEYRRIKTDRYAVLELNLPISTLYCRN